MIIFLIKNLWHCIAVSLIFCIIIPILNTNADDKFQLNWFCEPTHSDSHQLIALETWSLAPVSKSDVRTVWVCKDTECFRVFDMRDNRTIYFGWLANGDLKLVTTSEKFKIYRRSIIFDDQMFKIQNEVVDSEIIKRITDRVKPHARISAILSEVASRFPNKVQIRGDNKSWCDEKSYYRTFRFTW